MELSLGIVDTSVLVLSVGLAVLIGVRMRGAVNSLEGFLLGDRNLPWWAILGSIVATETSTATVLSVPALAFGPSGMRFLQIAIGFILGRMIVVAVLMPLFFQGRIFSAYEVLGNRFGGVAKGLASLLFLVTRNLGDGLRLFLAALVLKELVGWPLVTSAMMIGMITIAYTFFGGMRSVVWNDCVQLVIYMLGGFVTVFVIVGMIPGGWESFWEYANASGKLTVFQLAPAGDSELGFWNWLVSEPFSLWAGLLGGAVLTLGTHGTDQMMVQRYLSARSQADAGRAVIISGFVVFVQFALFLFIGVQLACYYSLQPEVVIERADEAYAHFIVHSFPRNTGIVGLMLAAILAAAMSTLSSSLNASASVVMNDFYLPIVKHRPDARRLVLLTRCLTVAFGAIQIGIGIGAGSLSPDSTVVGSALTIAGYSAGLLLGLFVLAVATKRVGQAPALIGSGIGLLVLLGVQFGLPELGVKVAWPWFALIGATVTVKSGYLLSFVIGSELTPRNRAS